MRRPYVRHPYRYWPHARGYGWSHHHWRHHDRDWRWYVSIGGYWPFRGHGYSYNYYYPSYYPTNSVYTYPVYYPAPAYVDPYYAGVPGYPEAAPTAEPVVSSQPELQPAAPAPEPVVVDSKVARYLNDLRSPDADTREDAADELGDMRAVPAVSALIQVLLYDSHHDVREEAAEALGKIGDPVAIPTLQHAAAYDPHRSVRKEAASALTKFGAR